MIYLLSFVSAKLITQESCPSKLISNLCSNAFHMLIVLSAEPEIMYLLSLVVTQQNSLFGPKKN